MALRFWRWSDSGGVERRRWFIDQIPWKGQESWQFLRCRQITDWTEQTVRGQPTKVLEDMPWTIDGTPMVSDRFRKFLEEEAPGYAQYLPLRMDGLGIDEIHRRYWIANWLRSVRCLDRSRSMNEYSLEEGGGTFTEWKVIDRRQIPEGVLVFRLDTGGDTMSTVLVRDDLKRKIIKAGFTGPQFYGVWHSDDPGAPAPLWKPGGGRVEREPPEGPWPGYH